MEPREKGALREYRGGMWGGYRHRWGCICSSRSLPVAAAKLLQLCLTLCDPIGGSPPGSAVPGILQARTQSPEGPSNHITQWSTLAYVLIQGKSQLLAALCESQESHRGGSCHQWLIGWITSRVSMTLFLKIFQVSYRWMKSTDHLIT